MKITIDYPVQLTFRKNGVFKSKGSTFKGKMERTQYLHQVLIRKQVASPCHDYRDYVVDIVEREGKENEYWGTGS